VVSGVIQSSRPFAVRRNSDDPVAADSDRVLRLLAGAERVHGPCADHHVCARLRVGGTIVRLVGHEDLRSRIRGEAVVTDDRITSSSVRKCYLV
jgi:hypothetical protein